MCEDKGKEGSEHLKLTLLKATLLAASRANYNSD